MRFKFRREERIHLDRVVEKILSHGHRFSEQFLTLIWLEQSATVLAGSASNIPPHRLAIRLRSHFNSSVVRNRTKRLLREVYRRHQQELSPGMDILLTVKFFEGIRRIKTIEMEERFITLCKKSGIWTG